MSGWRSGDSRDVQNRKKECIKKVDQAGLDMTDESVNPSAYRRVAHTGKCVKWLPRLATIQALSALWMIISDPLLFPLIVWIYEPIDDLIHERAVFNSLKPIEK